MTMDLYPWGYVVRKSSLTWRPQLPLTSLHDMFTNEHAGKILMTLAEIL